MDCFNPKKSDIDLIVVISNDISDSQKMLLMKEIVNLNQKAPAKGLEISLVKKEYCMYLQDTERAVSEYKNHHFFRL